MYIFDYEIIGRLVDEMGEDNLNQEYLNYMNIRKADSLNFLNVLSHRISKYSLNDYIEKFNTDNDVEDEESNDYYKEDFKNNDFWLLALRQIIRIYSLKCLSLFLHKLFDMDDLSEQIIKLIKFIKIDLIDMCSGEKNDPIINLNEIKDPDELISLAPDSPLLFKWAMKYIPADDFLNFLNTLKKEVKSEYFES